MITLENAAPAASNSDLATLLNAPLTRPTAAIELPLGQFTTKLMSAKRLDYACPLNHMHVSRVMPNDARQDDAYTVRLGNEFAFGMSDFAVRQLNQKLSLGTLDKVYNRFFKTEPFVRITPNGEQAQLKNVVGTNVCEISLVVGKNSPLLVITSVIDNLIKGAAGQAIQNMNIMKNYKETTALN